jgi:hypothetical protein
MVPKFEPRRLMLAMQVLYHLSYVPLPICQFLKMTILQNSIFLVKSCIFFLRIVAFFKNWQMAYDLKDVVYALYL